MSLKYIRTLGTYIKDETIVVNLKIAELTPESSEYWMLDPDVETSS